MKKFLHRLLSFSLAAVMVGSAALSAGAANLVYGDINGDGTINAVDALATLNYSIGKIQFTGDTLKAADVSGDGTVNAVDALMILNYSVGKIDTFPAEKKTPEAPASAEEILTVYSSALKNAISQKPAYRLDVVTDSKLLDMTVGGTLAAGLSKEEIDKMIEEQKAETDSHEENYVIAKQGSATSLNNLPVTFKDTNPSHFKSVTCSVNDSGNYLITIQLKDVNNPKTTDPIVTCMGAPSYEETKSSLEEEFGSTSANGINMSLTSVGVKYSNAKIVCEMNPVTNEIVALDYQFTNLVTVSMALKTADIIPISLIDITMKNQLIVDRSYSGFAY